MVTRCSSTNTGERGEHPLAATLPGLERRRHIPAMKRLGLGGSPIFDPTDRWIAFTRPVPPSAARPQAPASPTEQIFVIPLERDEDGFDYGSPAWSPRTLNRYWAAMQWWDRWLKIVPVS